MNRQYEDKLFWNTAWYMVKKWIMPMPLRYCFTSVKAIKYIGKGLKCLANRKLEVPVLDATAITASILTNDFATAGSVMFLLEIADITVSADNLYELVTLKELSNKLMSRINRNYRKIVTFNTGLIILGVMGVIQPTTSALLHNSSTLLISMDSMKKLLD